MSSTVNIAASTGFADGKFYDTHRPSYPADSVEGLLQGMGLAGKSGAKILEIAAGSGLFTECLARRPEGFQIVSVEPVEGMRQALVNKGLPNVTVLDGTADNVPGGDGEYDGVIAAQSFHWFATTSALTEFRRLLKPSGYFGTIYNIEDYNKPQSWPADSTYGQSLNDLIWALPDDGNGRFRNLTWRKAFSTPINAQADGSPLFGEVADGKSDVWVAKLTIPQVIDRIGTLSQVVALGQGTEERNKFNDSLEKVLKEEVDDKGQVEIHGRTYYSWVKRT